MFEEKDTYSIACKYCGKVYITDGFQKSQALAEKCEKEHRIIYFPISYSDLANLIQFIYTKDENLISETLFNNLKKYLKNARDVKDDLSSL